MELRYIRYDRILYCVVEFEFIYLEVLLFIVIYFQYYVDVNEVELWMKEKMFLVISDDYGRDEMGLKVSYIFSLILIF